ncbi:MAG: hypothetical protein A2847_00275 [Candidatus Sungbacteria bacterium RIFCSPHIGHO2_01_FULL_50_25]|uniref:Prepilin-type N-terminal cleavage/methylation domain-containing protein n=1 Tax=Candidatus Sungbacteria bacterium RIFCSPHIGHO2_01_FULL_50_25 TaxID=1802265 RepID=A0A1G2KAJ5_9BACT|nr:MAG: hypothetical protein A2847_00275 [Candidatus Sungbacteria bacterium RIFCSPHIGHO2_01_FULL_50_25]
MHEGGFSLLEVIIAISILIIITAAASVSFSSARQIRDLTTAGQNVLSMIRVAQSKTLAREDNSQWGVRIEQTQVILFRGAMYAGSNVTEAYPLPPTIEIANVALADGATEIVFKLIEGTTSQTGTFDIRVIANPSLVFPVTIESSGKAYRTGAAPFETGTRIVDARHRAFTLGWSIQNSIETALVFSNPPYADATTTITMENFFDAGKTKFDWSGTISVGTSTQILRIHTAYLSATNTVFHIDRDCRDNTKKMRIEIDAKYIATYEADCRTVTVGNFGGVITEP